MCLAGQILDVKVQGPGTRLSWIAGLTLMPERCLPNTSSLQTDFEVSVRTLRLRRARALQQLPVDRHRHFDVLHGDTLVGAVYASGILHRQPHWVKMVDVIHQ